MLSKHSTTELHPQQVVVFVFLEVGEGVFFLSLYISKSLFFCVYMVLGFELRAFTFSHSTSPIFVMDFFEIGS
jgi:hypothetical protein